MFRFGETLRLRFDIIATPANSSTVYDDTHSGIDSFILWCRRHLATCKIAPRDTCRDEVQILEVIIIFPCSACSEMTCINVPRFSDNKSLTAGFPIWLSGSRLPNLRTT